MQQRYESGLKAGAYASSIGAALLLGTCLGFGAAHAQSIMRTPTISIPSRTPTISPSVAARVSPTVGARVTGLDRGPGTRITPRLSARLVTTPVLPYVRYSPNLYPACAAPYRDAVLTPNLQAGFVKK